MHKILAIIAIVPTILGTVCVAYMFHGFLTDGFSGGHGMTILAFQLWGFLLTIAGFGLSSTALMLANRKNEPAYVFNGFTVTLSLFSLAAMVIGLAFL